jgi:hypothetical protein
LAAGSLGEEGGELVAGTQMSSTQTTSVSTRGVVILAAMPVTVEVRALALPASSLSPSRMTAERGW